MSPWAWVLIGAAWLPVATVVGVRLAQFLGRVRLIAEMDAEQRCAEGCGRVATHERFEAATTDGIPIVELTCHQHAGDGRPLEWKQ
jgi:hypothetical protein